MWEEAKQPVAYSSFGETLSVRVDPPEEMMIEARERYILEQYYAMSQILKTHMRGGSYLIQAARMTSPSQDMQVKVKTL
jgi:hypothetical protein